jgi:hypothetical protein
MLGRCSRVRRVLPCWEGAPILGRCSHVRKVRTVLHRVRARGVRAAQGACSWCAPRALLSSLELSRALSSSLELSRALHAIEEPSVIEASPIGGALSSRGA